MNKWDAAREDAENLGRDEDYPDTTLPKLNRDWVWHSEAGCVESVPCEPPDCDCKEIALSGAGGLVMVNDYDNPNCQYFKGENHAR